MRILFAIFEMMDWGGIIADLEFKARGLTEAGHTVDIVYLHHKDMDPKMRGLTTREGAYDSFFKGAQVHTIAGYFGIPIIGYQGRDRLKKWKKRTAKYDLVIFENTPNPANTADAEGNWIKVFDTACPNILSIHDANFRELYPFMIKVADKIKGISCTNQAGYANLSWFPAPRAFVGAPHPVLNWDKQKPWDSRKPQAVSAHVWKAWKRHDLQVKAARHLKNSNLILCGSGIEYHYMTSKNKRKEKYGDIWERGLAAGHMEYLGMITSPDLQKLYRQSRVMVDTAWSKKFANLGCHFNRSIIEGYNNGCVPIVVTENMYEDGFQLRMFKAGKTHFEISADHRPKELAQLIDHVANLHADDAGEIITRGRKILTRFFDYRKTSLQYLDLAEGKPAGVYPKLETGKLNKKIIKASERYIDVKVAKAIAKNQARQSKG